MLLLTGPNYSGKSVYMKQVSGSLDGSLGLSLNRCPGCPHRLSGADREVRQIRVLHMSISSTNWQQLRSCRERRAGNNRQDLDEDQYPGKCVQGMLKGISPLGLK